MSEVSLMSIYELDIQKFLKDIFKIDIFINHHLRVNSYMKTMNIVYVKLL